MKRKIFSLLMVFVLAISLTSCKKNKKVEVTYSSNETSMLVGDVKTITPEVTLGKKVKNFELTYSISDPTKATVDGAGNVTALAEGTVLLTATGNDKNETSASITIKISAPAPTVYTITYTLNGGTNPTGATTEFTDCANALLPTPTRSGYTFVGWYEGTTKVDAINQNKDYALTAKWEVETYSVKFVAEGVEVQALSYTVANKNITEPSVPEKTHYTGAWEAYTLDSGNKVVNAVYTPVTYTVTFVADGVTVETINYTVEATTITEPSVPAKDYNTGAWETYTLVGGNVTVNAVYTPVTYTVTFDAAGGAITQGSATVNGGNTVAKPLDPTKAGYVFKGWLLNSAAYDFTTPVTSDITLVASWEEEQPVVPTTYTVTFDVQGGSAVDPQTVEEGAQATKPADPTKAGYVFKGWLLNSAAYDFTTPVTSDITLVASWEEEQPVVPTTYTVTFDVQGGSAVDPQTVEEGAQATKPADPTKAGYVFKGWLLNSAAYDFTTPVTSDITLVASWEEEQPVVPTTYTVTFDVQGGSAVDPQTVEEGAQATKPADPTKAGYVFKGWLLNSAAYDFTTPVTSDIILVASWEEVVVTYTVTLDADGGVLTDTTIEFTNYEDVTLPIATKDGYLFKGWYEGTTKVEALSENKDYSLKASWEEIPANTYTVTFKADGNVVEVVTYEAGATSVTEPEVPEKAHYTGIWATYTLNDTNLEVNAEYTAKEYTLTFKANGETVQAVTYTYGATSVTEPTVPAKDHYTGSWPTYTLDGNYDVVAVYTAIEYSVKFMADGTEVEILTYSLDNTDITAPSVPAKDHYTGAWEAYTLDGGDKVVNAVYTAVTYTVSLDAGDGTVDPESITFTVEDTLADITLPTATQTGYNFLGWYEGTTKVEAITECKDYALVAEWEVIPATTTVTYNFNGGQYAAEQEFNLGGYNSYGVAGTHYYMALTTPDADTTNRFWHRVLIKEVEAGTGIYKAVYSLAVGSESAAGTTTLDGVTVPTGNTSHYTGEYDYIIGANSGAGYDTDTFTKIKNLVVSVAAGEDVYIVLNVPETTGAQVIPVKVYDFDPSIVEWKYTTAVSELPSASKTGYDFAGWYNNAELTGDAITSIEVATVDTTLALYAKYTPTTYTITYNLSGGNTTADLVGEYNIESATITLPTATEMSITNGSFTGWINQDGEAVTEIGTGTIGNITLEAQWLMDVATELVISDADATALNALYTDKSNQTATLLVNSSVTYAGKFVLSNTNLTSGYTDVEYVYRSNIFSSIADALEVAEEGAIIYVFAGTYSDAATISVANVIIAGPNYNVPFSSTRNDEANFTANISTSKNNLVLNGIQISSSAKVNYTTSVTGAELRYVYLTTTSFNAVLGDSGTTISGFIMDNCKLDNTSASTSYGYRPIRFSGTLKDAQITNNYFSYGIGNRTLVDTFYFNAVSGTIDIINNNFAQCVSTNYMMNIVNATAATKVRINGNSFNGTEAMKAAGIYIKTTSATTVVELVGNEFNNVDGNLFLTDGTGTYTIQYNRFLNTSLKMTITSTTNVTFGSNYFYTGNATTNTVLTDATPYATADECKAAYEAVKSTYETISAE